MKQCPICHIKMKRTKHEGFGIDKCPNCSGHLVRKIRLKGIKKTRKKTLKELKELAAIFKGSTLKNVKCPHCFIRMRKKHFLRPVDIELDLCPRCQAVWLDAGELAMLQIAYESSSKLKDAEMLKKRYMEFEASPERKKRFRKNLAKMRKGPSSILSAFGEGIKEHVYEVMHLITSSIARAKFPHVFILPALYKLFRNK